jgi:hypothetical protein
MLHELRATQDGSVAAQASHNLSRLQAVLYTKLSICARTTKGFAQRTVLSTGSSYPALAELATWLNGGWGIQLNGASSAEMMLIDGSFSIIVRSLAP